MSLDFSVRDEKRLRVIIDTDAACEADDPFAIAHALMSPKLIVRGILAEQFGVVRNEDSTEESYQEIRRILDTMGITDVPALRGAKAKMASADEYELSEASQFLIDEAMREDAHPLFVLCLGAVTNVACALRSRPEIAERMTVVWIGGGPYEDIGLPPGIREFNAGNDIVAANILMDTPVPLWQIPMDVYTQMRTSLAELQDRVRPCGAIGAHLFDQMVAYNATDWAFWTAGESWSLGDSPAVGVVLYPGCGRAITREAPVIEEDTSYRFEEGRRPIRVYRSIDARYILEDFFAKLRLLYGG